MKKKVNINRPDISSEEILKRKDFDSVLKQHTPINKPFFKKPWFLASAGIIAIAGITAVALKNTTKLSTDQALMPQTIIASDSSAALTDFYKREESKPCINPPLPGINIPVTVYKVIAEKGATLDFKTGSKILIPKNSFTDTNGKLIKGEVELHYREFRDPVDFFVSGIPMTYDSAGVRYHFESAGMMEIQAYQNGKPLAVASEKSINIELASVRQGPEYNLYKLDTLANNWSCLGKDKTINGNTRNSANDSHANGNTNQVNKNSETFLNTKEYKTIETKKEEVQKEKETKIASLTVLADAPKKPDLAKKNKYTFNLDINAKEFPELVVYKGALFEVGDENKNFTSAMFDVTWDEAIIKEGPEKGKNYLLTVKKASKSYDLVVYPVFEGKNYEMAQKEYQDKFNKYSVALDKRKIEEKKIEEAYQSRLAQLKQEQQELERKWKERQDNQFKLMSSQEKMYHVFAVNGFGIYNSDKPSAYPTGVSCTAKLNNEQGARLMCFDVFLVDREKNGLFSYTKNPVAKFSFNPQSKNLLWTVENGSLYWLKPEQFNEIKSTEAVSELKLSKVEQKFKNVEEMKTFFNF
jgi:hypothetical protein